MPLNDLDKTQFLVKIGSEDLAALLGFDGAEDLAVLLGFDGANALGVCALDYGRTYSFVLERAYRVEAIEASNVVKVDFKPKAS